MNILAHVLCRLCHYPAFALVAVLGWLSFGPLAPAAGDGLSVGFHSADITPKVDGETPVWLAGYGWGRAATGIRDRLYARTVVLHDTANDRWIALVSVDLVGMQFPEVALVRERLAGFDYVMVSSTHNHEGPDTIGIWGKTPFKRGVDKAYLSETLDKIVESVRAAKAKVAPTHARYGTAEDETLVDDNRKPKVKDAILRTIVFERVEGDSNSTQTGAQSPLGVLVQWNCHPEALGSKNTLVTADFCHATVKSLEAKYSCPVAYFTGAVGGLMAPPDNRFQNDEGRVLLEGEFEYADRYGEAVAALASKAIEAARPIQLVPFKLQTLPIAIPVENALYRTARVLGVLRRQAVRWTGDFHNVENIAILIDDGQFAVRSEVGYLKLGELGVACIPGEIYPELVYGVFQEPAESAADFPEAPLESHVAEVLQAERWLLFGLANDEIGYIIPKRQWDAQAPFAYGRKKSQYGEINSCGPETAPIIMKALHECANAVHAAAEGREINQPQ